MSHERLTAILRTMVQTLSEPSPPGGELELARWLKEKELTSDDQRAFGSVGPSRLFLYRTLVRRGLGNAIREEIPRTAARLGDRFEDEVNRFVSEEMPRSHYLRDVPVEMVEWAAARWNSDPTLPPFLADLARHELSAFEVAGADAASATEFEPELRLDRPVVLDPATRVRRYAFPIHLLGDDEVVLAPKLTTLLVYRDAEHDVRYLELTPLAGLIVDHLLAKDPLGTAITSACVTLGVGFPVEESARFFADLAERGVLLGASKTQ